MAVDPVPDLPKETERFDSEMDEVAGARPFVALDRQARDDGGRFKPKRRSQAPTVDVGTPTTRLMRHAGIQ